MAAADELDLTTGKVRTALAYDGAYPDEIDGMIAANEQAAADARRADEETGPPSSSPRWMRGRPDRTPTNVRSRTG